jgi:methionyl-tRNA formyltransferase
VNLVFMGSGRFAIPILDVLAAAPEHKVLAVVSQPDRPRGRGLQTSATPVAEHAEAKGLFLYEPEDVGAYEFVREMRALSPELIVVAAYGQFLTRDILSLPKWGCVNVHASLLPRWRGPAPVARAILQGDRRTGVTVHKLVEKMDAGDILAQREEEIRPTDTTPELEERLAAAAGPLVLQVLKEFAEGTVRPRRQDEHKATHARKFDKQEGEIRWGRSARQIGDMVRAMQPYPGAFTFYAGQRLVIFEARPAEGGARAAGAEPGTISAADAEGIRVRCGEGELVVTSLQPENRRRMSAQEFLAGHTVSAGERLGRPGGPPPEPRAEGGEPGREERERRGGERAGGGGRGADRGRGRRRGRGRGRGRGGRGRGGDRGRDRGPQPQERRKPPPASADGGGEAGRQAPP